MSDNFTPLTDPEWEELLGYGRKAKRGTTLTETEKTRCDALAKRIKIQQPPPVPPPPGTLPDAIKIPILTTADTLAGDPGVGGPVA